ncbi:MAG TPA: hypothetical protein VFT72_16680 [Opitutaceae bacterium]|nr:hypothetical protein [Opitutaceae bacterium]
MRRFCLISLFCLFPAALFALEPLSLAGKWSVRLDPKGAGEEARWYLEDASDAGTIALPGSLEENRIGDPITVQTQWTGDITDRSYFTQPEYEEYRRAGNIKVPFWLQPETHFVGAAWYQRSFEIPASWQGKSVQLVLERPHWRTTVWLDGRLVGTNDALSVPHRYDLGAALTAGTHRLTVRVQNNIDPDIGTNSHSITDHTQGNWNGIVGQISLLATEGTGARIDDVQIYPARTGIVAVRGKLARSGAAAFPAEVNLSLDGGATTARAVVATDGSFAGEVRRAPFAKNELWSEFTPVLHRLKIEVAGGDSRECRFGVRDFKAAGRQLAVNDVPAFLRGTLDCAAYPRSGYPPMETAEWKRVMSTIKAHGLNHIRFHSWCPPEAAFQAADELGLYLQVEVASWPNWSTTLGDGKPVDAWIQKETSRILREYGNHPSFVMLCAGNEPGGKNYAAWLEKWVSQQKNADPRRVYTSGAGWPELAVNDYNVTPEPRIQHWGDGLKSRINAMPPETETNYADFILERHAPVVSHEIGQWCVFPNFAEMPKYTGYLKPRNFEIFQANFERHGLSRHAHDFLIASGKLQALCYKEEIESALRTPQMAGFQLLGLSDFPGQGTALVGVLDAFWEDKGYISAAEFRRFCSPTVPLARLSRRVFTTSDHLTARVEVAHFGDHLLSGLHASWSLRADDGRVAASGRFEPKDVAAGGLAELGRVDVELEKSTAPARYKLVVQLEAPETGSKALANVSNDWDVWIYPDVSTLRLESGENAKIVTELNASDAEKLNAGGTLIWTIPPAKVAPDPQRGPIALGFSSIFWNTAWTSGQAPHTLGIFCDPKSSALAEFPTDGWSNWQWWYPIAHAAPMLLDRLPRELEPTVSVIDDWVTSRKLALIFEAKCGSGRIIVTSIDLNESVLDPVRRQLRASLLHYATSTSFKPSVEVSIDQLKSLAIQ